MADNNLAKTLGGVRLTSTFQAIYTAASSGFGKQATGYLTITPLDASNTVYIDVLIYDGTNYLPVLENAGYDVGSGENIPLTLADGQIVYARVRSDITALTVSAISQATPAVVTVNSTTGLAQSRNSVIYLSGEDTTDLAEGLFRADYVSATTFNLKTMLDADQANTTDAGTAGTITIVPAFASFHAFEQTIPQE